MYSTSEPHSCIESKGTVPTYMQCHNQSPYLSQTSALEHWGRANRSSVWTKIVIVLVKVINCRSDFQFIAKYRQLSGTQCIIVSNIHIYRQTDIHLCGARFARQTTRYKDKALSTNANTTRYKVGALTLIVLKA